MTQPRRYDANLFESILDIAFRACLKASERGGAAYRAPMQFMARKAVEKEVSDG